MTTVDAGTSGQDRRPRAAGSTTGEAAPVVAVHQPNGTSLHLVLHGPLEVGREGPGLLVDDDLVSRYHLRLSPRDGRVVVEDLGSTNGTTLDGRKIEGPASLETGAVVRLGNTTVRLVARGRDVPGPAREDVPVTSIDRVAAEVAADRPDPPSASIRNGTVTIVFTDIESSTQQAEAFGDQRWFHVLTTHNRIVRERISEYGGTEIKSQGDGFMLTFPSARGAVRCMIAVQRDMTALRETDPEHGVRIRVGAHTGEAIVGDDGDLFGLHVNVAARVAGQAAGDEILVSSLVREIVATRGDLRFGEPRPTELKGLAGTFVVHPVVWAESA